MIRFSKHPIPVNTSSYSVLILVVNASTPSLRSTTPINLIKRSSLQAEILRTGSLSMFAMKKSKLA